MPEDLPKASCISFGLKSIGRLSGGSDGIVGAFSIRWITHKRSVNMGVEVPSIAGKMSGVGFLAEGSSSRDKACFLQARKPPK